MIRKGNREDLPKVLELIKELAMYEKAPEQVETTVETMEKDGFGRNAIFRFLVAEKDGDIVGASIFYHRYSTWKGRRLFLEDLIVTESVRGQGYGQQLFEATLQIAKDEHCTGLSWQVLDWNEPAINFYKKYDVDFDSEWVNCSISF